ncbi:hypothetical protein CCYN2B_20042 [Capnocytophaga cynodegmi]|uniref:Uncharacterized protein n=1 Tax=Capnocytophaga cynodegmi TaxID=28189 RepID=A0A0B7H6U1_9FLAO|nr:hypothetical protein CCYN2B_20042 [Capnocytophaga cynodegmi]
MHEDIRNLSEKKINLRKIDRKLHILFFYFVRKAYLLHISRMRLF